MEQLECPNEADEVVQRWVDTPENIQGVQTMVTFAELRCIRDFANDCLVIDVDTWMPSNGG
jgi:hypothetical protein